MPYSVCGEPAFTVYSRSVDPAVSVGIDTRWASLTLAYYRSSFNTIPAIVHFINIDFLFGAGYLLTRVEGKIGSPEKPLSDLGLISYRSYWKDVLLQHLCSHPGASLSIRDMSQEMAINSYDIVSTLQALGMMKYWKGKHIILKRQVCFQVVYGKSGILLVLYCIEYAFCTG